MSSPLVSVVVAAHDCERFIGAALDSAFAQDYAPLEVIVVDDGSTDATPVIVAGYPVRLIRQVNAGQGAARNAGASAAKGDLIAFLDHDDVWFPAKLSRQVEALLARPDAGGSLATLEVLLEPGAPHPPWLPRSKVYPHFPPSAWLLRRTVFEEVGPFATASAVPDFDWMLRARDLGYTFDIIREPLGFYRFHGENASYRRAEIREASFGALKGSLDRMRGR